LLEEAINMLLDWGHFEFFSLGLASKVGWQPLTIAHLI
jgi:hypothetical protein